MTRRINSHVVDDALYLRQKQIAEIRSLLYPAYIRGIKALPAGSESSTRLTDFYHDAALIIYQCYGGRVGVNERS